MLFGGTFADGVIATLAVMVVGWLSYRRWFRKRSDEEIRRRITNICCQRDPMKW